MPEGLGTSFNQYDGHLEYIETADEQSMLEVLQSIRQSFVIRFIYPKPNGHIVAWIHGDLRVKRKQKKGNDNG